MNAAHRMTMIRREVPLSTYADSGGNPTARTLGREPSDRYPSAPLVLPPSCDTCCGVTISSGVLLHETHDLGDLPDGTSELPGHGDRSLRSRFAPMDQAMEARIEPGLGGPGDGHDRRILPFLAATQGSPYFGWSCIVPGSFDQHPPHRCIAGFRNPTPPDTGTTGVFRRRQPSIGHHLARMIEPRTIAQFGNQGGGVYRADPLQCLPGQPEWRQRATLHLPNDFGIEPRLPSYGQRFLFDQIDQHQLLGQVIASYRGQPSVLGFAPGTAPGRWPQIKPQQKLAQPATCSLQILAGLLPHPHQVPQRFMRCIRHPDRCQVTTAI